MNFAKMGVWGNGMRREADKARGRGIYLPSSDNTVPRNRNDIAMYMYTNAWFSFMGAIKNIEVRLQDIVEIW